jgi:hypothetical protein
LNVLGQIAGRVPVMIGGGKKPWLVKLDQKQQQQKQNKTKQNKKIL